MKGLLPDRILRIDLTSRAIHEETIDERLMRAVLGGRGIAAHWLAEAGIWRHEPLSPEAAVVIAPGMLGGTPWPSASRYHLGFRSPLTGIYGYGNAGGLVGSRLAAQGIGAVVITGRADAPVFLRLASGTATLEPATDQWGMSTSRTEVYLRQRSPRAAIACIGPAGEALVRFAAVINDGGRAAARCGGGAVFGFKRLKAFVVETVDRQEIPDGFRELASAAAVRLLADPAVHELREVGTPILVALKNERGDLPAWNHRRGQVPFIDRIAAPALERYQVGRKACAGCPIRCGWISEVPSGPHRSRSAGPEYETIDALAANCACSDPEVLLHANARCNDLGLDTISTGAAIAFAMECAEHGLLGDRGNEISWGDGAAILSLIDDIASRRDLGDILADGVRAASHSLGEATQRFAMHVKGLEIPGQDPRASKGFGLGHATSNRGADHLYALPTIAVAGLEHAAADLFPDLLPDILDPLDEETKPELVVASENYSAVSDALGVCKFTTTETYALRVEDLADALTAWGWPVDGRALLEAGERIVNLERLLNARMGISSQDDCLPERFLSEPVVVSSGGKARTITLKSLPDMLSRYYTLRGWTSNGHPTEETCERLGLTRWREA